MQTYPWNAENRIQFILTHKANKEKGIGKIKIDYITNSKWTDAPVIYIIWINLLDRTDIRIWVSRNGINANNIYDQYETMENSNNKKNITS